MILSAHDGADKLLVVDVAVRVLVSRQQLLDLLVAELLSQRGEEVPQLGGRDEAVPVLVEVAEALDEVLGGVGGAAGADGLWCERNDEIEVEGKVCYNLKLFILRYVK